MKILNVVQGSPEWLELRFAHHCASEAAAMMDQSKHMSRAELVRLKALGLRKEYTDWVQKNVLDKGHESEAATLALAESFEEESLYPVVVESDDGKCLASLDGMSMGEDLIWENKSWNEELASMVRAGELTPHYYWQLEAQLEVVTSATHVFFTCSDGTTDHFEAMDYTAVPGRREALQAARVQFDKDVAEYQHVEVPPQAVGHSMQTESLPLVEVSVSGQLAVISNLENFGQMMTAWIRRLDMKPSTDEAFANTDLAIKELERAEVALLTAKDRALKQTSGIDEVCRLVDSYHGTARTTRLLLQRLLADRKTQIRAEIIQEGKAALAKHIAELQEAMGRPYMPEIPSDFPKAIANKRTVQGLRDGMTTHLSFTKMAASAIAVKIQKNLHLLREGPAKDHPSLFPDEKQIVLKDPEDLAALITNRITAHEAAEAAKPVPTPAPASIAAPASVPQALNVVPMGARAPAAPTSPPTLLLGAICRRLGFLVTADFLKSLGFDGTKDRNAVLFHESDFPGICDALIAHTVNVRDARQAA